MQPDTIPFVQEYCDRWCVRCALVARCPVGPGALQRTGLLDTPEDDVAELAGTLQRAVTMLEAACVEQGIDLDDLEEAFDPVDLEDPLVVFARFWMGNVFDWVEQAAPEPLLVEMASRYAVLVPSKLVRALMHDDDDELPAPQSDAMGSAKVATVALHRLLASLTDHLTVRPLDPAGQRLAAQTLTLIGDIEQRLPGHLAFHRPGFDDLER